MARYTTREVLKECLDYLENREDCETLMDCSQRPNQEAVLADMIRTVLADLDNPKTKTGPWLGSLDEGAFYFDFASGLARGASSKSR